MPGGVLWRYLQYNMIVEDIPLQLSKITKEAIKEIRTPTLNGFDLHVYHGVQGGTRPWNMGHETFGYTTGIGGVSSLNVGYYDIFQGAKDNRYFKTEPI